LLGADRIENIVFLLLLLGFVFIKLLPGNALIKFVTICNVNNYNQMKWAGHAAQMGARRNAYRILVGKPDGKRPLGRPRRRWVDIIKMDLREVGWDGRDWIDLAQDRDRWRAHVNAVMNLRVP
jgi:hypothetical protein